MNQTVIRSSSEGHAVASNVERARGVLPASGWQVGPLRGRYFTANDGDALAQLGVGDPAFAWERQNQDATYYRGLLRFRLSHYKKYGFGVQAVLLDDQLIGQCGLQVLNTDQGTVEFVVFLGKDYVGRGWGSLLLTFLLSRCTRAGMSEVYGVVRQENVAAIGLVEGFGGKLTGRIEHFGQDALLYRIELQG